MNLLIMGKGMRIKHNLPPTNPRKVWVDFFLKEAFHGGKPLWVEVYGGKGIALHGKLIKFHKRVFQ